MVGSSRHYRVVLSKTRLTTADIWQVKALSNATPVDVYYGRRDDIMARRKNIMRRTLQARKEYNGKGRSCLDTFDFKTIVILDGAPNRWASAKRRFGVKEKRGRLHFLVS